MQPYSSNATTLTNANAYHHANLLSQASQACVKEPHALPSIAAIMGEPEPGLAAVAAAIYCAILATEAPVSLDQLLVFLPVGFGVCAILAMYRLAAAVKVSHSYHASGTNRPFLCVFRLRPLACSLPLC